ncbi:MAG TPA: universal stress protein [Parasulfuritortus sp.]
MVNSVISTWVSLMYKHILVAYDGSEVSDLALAEAINLALELKSELRLVYVVDAAMLFDWNADFVDIVALEDNLVESGRQTLNKALSVCKAAGVQAETSMPKAEHYDVRVADLIRREASAWPADLVVIGTHGRRGFSHLVLGSVAEGVIRTAQTPVLLVRGDEKGG